MVQQTSLKPTFILKGHRGSSVVYVPDLCLTGGRLAAASCEPRAGSGGCRPSHGDQLRAGRLSPVGCSSATLPAPAALCPHEAPADEAPSCQSEAESGRRQRACTGASALPGRGRVWLILARTRASPSGCRAPMSSSRFMGASSPTHCRRSAG